MIGLCFVLSLMFGPNTVAILLTILIWIYVLFNSNKLIRKEKFKGVLFVIIFSCAMIFFSGRSGDEAEYDLCCRRSCCSHYSFKIRCQKIKYFTIWGPVLIYLGLLIFVMNGVEFIATKALQEYQLVRIETMLGITEDADANYNVTQSKMTIGSGGIAGKGYLHGILFAVRTGSGAKH